MRKIIVFHVFILLTIGLKAQQLPQYSMFMLNPYHYNTSFAGLDESLSATAVFRKQWVDFPGTPLNFNFNTHLPLVFINSGVGLSFEQDIIGAYSNTYAKASYNYIMDFNSKSKLSFGGAFKFMQKTLDGTRLRAPDGDYENGLDHNDNFIPLSRVSNQAYTFDAGIYYKDDKFQIGIAANNITAPTLRFDASAIQQIQYLRNFVVNASYSFNVNEDFILEPSVLIKTDMIKYQPELALLLKYQNKFFGGLSYRGYSKLTSDAVVLLAGMQINKNFMLAYAYDFSISGLKNFNSGSHEIILNYNLRKELSREIPAKIIYNQRFL